jgi:hypothetical protein
VNDPRLRTLRHTPLVDIEGTKDKDDLSERTLDVITVELAWRHWFPNLTLPHQKFLRGWLNRQPVPIVIAAIEAAWEHSTTTRVGHISPYVTHLLNKIRFTT